MTVPPEIKKLRSLAWGDHHDRVWISDAEQAVRDAEARVRAGSLRDGMQRAFVEGVAAERARILALLDEPRAHRLALAEYAARREQGHDRFEAMRLAVAAVRALVGGDDCARSLPRDTPSPEDTDE